MSRHIRTTVRLPDELMKQAKRRAAALDTTLTAMIEEGLRIVLSVAARKPGKGRLPRVSSAKGKVLVDLSDTSALLDKLDKDIPFEKLR
jgi:hypothetical protein